jgi:Fe2+ or Zn2+ uptake regulation protein
MKDRMDISRKLEMEDEILSILAPRDDEIFSKLVNRSTGWSLAHVREVLDDMVKRGTIERILVNKVERYRVKG